MVDREGERQRTQAEGEAGSTQGARRGTRSGVSRITPWAEGGAKPLSHPGIPGTNNLKICVESEKTPNSQGNIEKEYQSQGHHNAGFQVVLQSCDHEDNVVLSQKQAHRSMEQNREYRNGPSTLWSTNIRQSRKDHPLEKGQSLQ